MFLFCPRHNGHVTRPGTGKVENALRRMLLLVWFLFSGICLWAQDYVTHNGFVSFFGERPYEHIRADNHEVESILHTKTGNIEFHALIKSFHFKRKSFEKAFDDKYMEANLYPESDFYGKILDVANINFNKPGTYNVVVHGNLTIHNVTREVKHPGILTITGDGLMAKSQFTVKLKDFNIKAPKLFGKKLVTEINVAVDMNYTPVKDKKDD